MNTKKLWTKLFSRKSEEEELELTVSGAMVRHRNPFEDIVVLRNETALSKEFVDKWVVPFYMSIHSGFDIDETAIANAMREIDADIVGRLLGDFNWRIKLCGAFFAAIKRYRQFEETIGNHLLKSEVCYAGTGYCMALAEFDTDEAKKYLARYLDYYLDRKDLWFDQADAYCALEYIDAEAARKFDERWSDFVSDKEHWNLQRSRDNLKSKFDTIQKIRKLLSQTA